MPQVDDPEPAGPGGIDHLADSRGDLGSVDDLAEHPNLHVVDQQRHPARVAGLPESARDAQPECAFHVGPPFSSPASSSLPSTRIYTAMWGYRMARATVARRSRDSAA